MPPMSQLQIQSRNRFYLRVTIILVLFLAGIFIGRQSTWSTTNRIRQENVSLQGRIKALKGDAYHQKLKNRIAGLEARVYVYKSAYEVIESKNRSLLKECEELKRVLNIVYKTTIAVDEATRKSSSSHKTLK